MKLTTGFHLGRMPRCSPILLTWSAASAVTAQTIPMEQVGPMGQVGPHGRGAWT